MTAQIKYKDYFYKLKLGERKTLKDEQTQLFIKANQEVFIVKVDQGIIKNTTNNIRKCDYLIYDEGNSKTHLIELKGAIIDAAFKQLDDTITNILELNEIKFLLEGLQLLDAYIVSPKRQEIPRGIESKERQLARKLAARCSSNKPDNIFELIKYVKVVRTVIHSRERNNNRQILCSNDHPIVFS